MGRTKQVVKTVETNATTIKLDGSEEYGALYFDKGYEPVENPASLLFLEAWNKRNEYPAPHFQVLDAVETLPGTYMYKNGELVPYGSPFPSQAIIFQRLTLRECKAVIDKYGEI